MKGDTNLLVEENAGLLGFTGWFVQNIFKY